MKLSEFINSIRSTLQDLRDDTNEVFNTAPEILENVAYFLSHHLPDLLDHLKIASKQALDLETKLAELESKTPELQKS